MRWTTPAPDEERVYEIARGFAAPLRVRIRGVPPCLWCGVPVTSPSMDGPLVCPCCDMGCNPDGSTWTNEDHKKRHQHFKDAIFAYVAAAREDEGGAL